MFLLQEDEISEHGFRRRASHELNRMLMMEDKGFFAFAFDSANEVRRLYAYIGRDNLFIELRQKACFKPNEMMRCFFEI